MDLQPQPGQTSPPAAISSRADAVLRADLPAQTSTALSGDLAASSEHLAKPHNKLKAEKIFDVAVYGVWNYGIQTTASVAAAMWFTKGGGRPYFEKSAEWMGKNVMSKITSKTGAAAAEEAHTPLIFSALITVGNLFIPPMQYVENRKVQYVSHINDWLNERRAARGDAPGAAELAEQQKALEAISEEPKQTTASLWGGRFAGLAANYVAAHLVTETRNKKMKYAFADVVSKGFDGIGLHRLANSDKMKTFSEIAFLDYGYSIISSNVVYAYSHFINPPKHEPAVKQAESATSSPEPVLANTIQIEPNHAALLRQ